MTQYCDSREGALTEHTETSPLEVELEVLGDHDGGNVVVKMLVLLEDLDRKGASSRALPPMRAAHT